MLKIFIKFILGVVCIQSLAQARLFGPELPDLVERVSAGVVNIKSIILREVPYSMNPLMREFLGIPLRFESAFNFGSGFRIGKQGVIVTNYHVVHGAREIQITRLRKDRKDHAKPTIAKLIGYDQGSDIAILMLDQPAPEIKSLAFGDSNKLRIGESVFAIGNPWGLSHTVTTGIVSAKDRSIGQGQYDRFIQTDATINLGNSGGPLLNFSGKVIGVTSAIHAKAQGVGYALPSNNVNKIVSDLLEVGYVKRAWCGAIGTSLGLISPYELQRQNISINTGVLVLNVWKNTPCDAAGIRAGDIILNVDQDDVQQIQDIRMNFEDKNIGDSADIIVLRKKEFVKLPVTLGRMPKSDVLPQLPDYGTDVF